MNSPAASTPGDARAEALRRWTPVLVVSAAILILGLGGDGLREWGRYERDGLAQGEVWRLLTAHLVHLGWGHLWLNLVALLVMAAVFDAAMEAADWVLAGIVGAVAVDVGLIVFHGNLAWYVGLSGVLDWLMLVCGFGLVRSAPPVGWGLLAGLAGKLVWEQLAGPLPLSESATGGPVVVNAHLYGAVGGAGALIISTAARRLTR